MLEVLKSTTILSPIQGVGTVISGTCMQGVIKLSDTLLLGPTSLGEFVPVPIRSIQRKRLPVTEVRGGQTASFAIKKVSDSVCYATSLIKLLLGPMKYDIVSYVTLHTKCSLGYNWAVIIQTLRLKSIVGID